MYEQPLLDAEFRDEPEEKKKKKKREKSTHASVQVLGPAQVYVGAIPLEFLRLVLPSPVWAFLFHLPAHCSSNTSLPNKEPEGIGRHNVSEALSYIYCAHAGGDCKLLVNLF